MFVHMIYEIGKIELEEENGHEFLVLTTKSQDVYDESYSIVVSGECIVNQYKKCIKEYGSFEKLPIQWRVLQNMVTVPVELKSPILIKNDALGIEYETSTILVHCKYVVDDELVASRNLKDAITWAKGWSPEERALFYNNHPVVHVPSTTV